MTLQSDSRELKMQPFHGKQKHKSCRVYVRILTWMILRGTYCHPAAFCFSSLQVCKLVPGPRRLLGRKSKNIQVGAVGLRFLEAEGKPSFRSCETIRCGGLWLSLAYWGIPFCSPSLPAPSPLPQEHKQTTSTCKDIQTTNTSKHNIHKQE